MPVIYTGKPYTQHFCIFRSNCIGLCFLDVQRSFAHECRYLFERICTERPRTCANNKSGVWLIQISIYISWIYIRLLPRIDFAYVNAMHFVCIFIEEVVYVDSLHQWIKEKIETLVSYYVSSFLLLLFGFWHNFFCSNSIITKWI